MSEAEAVAATETAEVTDAQVDQFFESGGDDADVQAEPEQAQAEPEQPAEEAKPEKTVPYGALHEERMRRKELQDQVNAYGAKTEQMEQAFRRLVERAQETPAPDYDTDPLNALKHQNDQLTQRLAMYDQRFQQADQQQAAYTQQQKFVSDYQQAAQSFAQETPDFQDAYKHLVNTRQSELESIGYTQQEAANILVSEESMIVGKAMQDGVNPASIIYQLAKTRGYQHAEPKAEAKPQSEKMDALEKGAKASRTLSGGGTAKGDVSLETLAGLSDDEFDAAWNKLIGPDS